MPVAPLRVTVNVAALPSVTLTSAIEKVGAASSSVTVTSTSGASTPA